MPGKRISSETHTQIKILYEEGYSTRQIARRLHVTQRTVPRSIFNFKKSGEYGFKKTTGRLKITNKRMEDSIILVAKNYPESHPESSRLDYQNVLYYPAKEQLAGDFLTQI